MYIIYPSHERGIVRSALLHMKNRVYASRPASVISVLLLISMLLLMQPRPADAATLTRQVVKRLCDRQSILGSRLARALIDPALCAEIPPPAKPTLTFTTDPTSITQGGSSMLTWDSTNATSCTASGGWSGSKALSGSQSVAPNATTTYTLTCTGAGGSVTESASVNVTTTPTPVPTITFTADPASILPNGTSTLAWSTSNVTFCVASDAWSGTKATSGTQDVTPSATSTYALSCGGESGTTTASVTVNVGAHPLPTVILTASPTSVTPGAGSATSTLTWSSTNATSCTAFGGWSGPKGLSGTEIVTPSATTTYQLDCTGPGGVGGDNAIVDFVPSPTPSVDYLLISEVHYDPDGARGADANEWIEFYNPTDSIIDLSNWWIADVGGNDKFPDGTTIAAGGFLVLTSASTTSGLWNNTPMISIEGLLGNGLGNTGDVLSLLNANGATTTVDALSWGSNVSVFTLPDVDDGHSLVRLNLNADTDTAADWSDDATPAPR